MSRNDAHHPTTSLPPTDANPFPAGDAPQQIEPGVWRIPVPLPLALRSANIYLLAYHPARAHEPTADWAIVDSGLGLPADHAALRLGMRQAGVTFAQVHALILTHAHPDHIGLSGPIHAASAAPIHILAPEAESLYRVWPLDTPDADAAINAIEAMYLANGLTPDDAPQARAANRRLRSMLQLPPRSAIAPLTADHPLQLGAHTYTPIWTPGHSDHHMCLLRDDGLFIAGDHILPTITPNIGLYPNSRPNPLGDYYNALAHVRNLPVRLALPGHGRPFTTFAARVDDLRDHHQQRAQRILTILAAQPANAATVAAHLFGDRLRDADDRRFALVETLAHLEYQRAIGHIERLAPPHPTGHITYRLPY